MRWDYLLDIIESTSTSLGRLLRINLFPKGSTDGKRPSSPITYYILQELLSALIMQEVDGSIVASYGVRVPRGNRRHFRSFLRICHLYSSAERLGYRGELDYLRSFIEDAHYLLPRYEAKDLSESRSADIALLLKEDEDDPTDGDSAWLTTDELEKRFFGEGTNKEA